MEDKKSKKGLVGILITIIIVLLLAICYLLFGEELLNQIGSKTTTTTSTTVVTNNTNKPVVKKVIEIDPATLLTDSDLRTNFSRLVKNESEIKFDFTCQSYDDDIGRCDTANYVVDGIIRDEYLDLVTCGYSKLFKTNKYYILEGGEGCNGTGMEFKIYSFDGKILFFEKNGTTYKNETYIENNKLYFNTYEEINSDENTGNLFYKYVDLSKERLEATIVRKELVNDRPQID